MPKVKRSIVEISGKFGDQVIVDTKKNGRIIRKAPKAGSKKDEVVLKRQYSRTKFLNKIASELNTIMNIYAGVFKGKDFYPGLQKLFRKQPLDNRLLLLRQLKGMEINRAYPSDCGYHTANVKAVKNKIVVNLQVQWHTPDKKFPSDCYYYKIILLTWNKSKKRPQHTSQFSEWIDRNGGKPEFDFLFPRPAGTTHWLLCIHQVIGLNKRRLETFAAESIYVADIGSFDKKEQALLDRINKEKIRKPGLATKPVDNVVRVKAKNIS